MNHPVDASTTPAWSRLRHLADTLQPDLRAWFDDDPERAQRLSFTAGDLFVDLSKGLLTGEVLAALLDLAEQVDLPERREAMFSGQHINVTEDRAVLHTALRLPADARLVVGCRSHKVLLDSWHKAYARIPKRTSSDTAQTAPAQDSPVTHV